ncbi:hypothetical protein MBAV_006288 [Candidatus Magnetobacterium bavaricum]|uniref:Uncharacterized protein n=1 Tax=Candidatus Magnetobacterium bavaricum TaxID=29290 RepID=A0A0F3GHU1_9BACT|nr:hypothetical protein MBAV_006288 [Candidatus Magnetobacterium bavaricum]
MATKKNTPNMLLKKVFRLLVAFWNHFRPVSYSAIDLSVSPLRNCRHPRTQWA